jgi:hypothetical protein
MFVSQFGFCPGSRFVPFYNDMLIGFLECHMVLPVYLPNDITSSENTSFAIPSSKHVITWIMVKNAKDKTEPQEQQSLRPKIFLSTLEYAEIPRSELELLNYCLQQLEQEWSSICRAAEDHLAQMVGELTYKSILLPC